MTHNTKDIGIVLLTNKECTNYSSFIKTKIANNLQNYTEVKNNPHVTAIHIGNLNEEAQANLKRIADVFFLQFQTTCIEFPIAGIRATGGNLEDGFKWLDLEFKALEPLKELRAEIVKEFCPFHNGTLTRMNDDISKFSLEQLEQIKKCGVTFDPYIPHITLWYIDLPNEDRTNKLQYIAQNLTANISSCYAESIALVELGRNGNAVEIITTYPLCLVEEL